MEQPSDDSTSIHAPRSSHDRFTALVRPARRGEAHRPSEASDWSIAQVASHPGSQAEIFRTDARRRSHRWPAARQRPAPGRLGGVERTYPTAQVTDSVTANGPFLARSSSSVRRSGLPSSYSLFDPDVDLRGLAATRLGEHAVRTWTWPPRSTPTRSARPRLSYPCSGRSRRRRTTRPTPSCRYRPRCWSVSSTAGSTPNTFRRD